MAGMTRQAEQPMWEQLFRLDPRSNISLQKQLRGALVQAILEGHISQDDPLPSSRALAAHLKISRNTVVLSYQHLVDDGYLIPRKRSGFFVNPDILEGRIGAHRHKPPEDHADWQNRLIITPSRQRNITKPNDWRRYQFPFIYGQPDPGLFPTAAWRECCRQAQSVSEVHLTSLDLHGVDDPTLIEQIQNRILPRRGVWAEPDQILVTLGAQHALYLIAELLSGPGRTVGMENPGYPDARNIFRLTGSTVKPLDVDQKGLITDKRLDDCDLLYATPSHHAPSTVTLPKERRLGLLNRAKKSDFVIIEDDYESETNFVGDPTPALKSLDRNGRVIYIGSLSKTLSPGLRLGFMVGPAPLIREARALRRLMLRHPPANNQRLVALFLSLGHHNAHILRMNTELKRRWQAMKEALATHLPNCSQPPTFGGTSYWVGRSGLDADQLAETAGRAGILIEPGDVYFMQPNPPKHFFRLGYASIPADKIKPGIERLAHLIEQQLAKE